MTRATTWGVRAAVLLTMTWPLVGEAGMVDLPGTIWGLTGSVRVSGVARMGRRYRSFHDRAPVQVAAGFPAEGLFTAVDAAGWNYSGTYEQRGRNGATVKLIYDAASEIEFDAMLSSWLSGLAGEAVTADGRATAPKAVIRGDKATLTATRRFRATSASAVGRGTWTLRATGSRL